LETASLKLANLNDSDLQSAQMKFADLTGANIENSNLRGANLSKAIITKANFSNSNLQEALLSESTISNSNLSNSSLEKADFANATIDRVNFEKSNLGNANLASAEIASSNLSNTILNNSIFSNAIVTGVSFDSAIMSNSKFLDALVTESDFTSANLQGAKFNNALLNSVTLSGANLKSADFFNTELITPYLSEASLEPVKNLGTVRWAKDYVIGEEKDGDLKTAIEIYNDLYALFESRNLPRIAEKFKYREKAIAADFSPFPINIVRKMLSGGGLGLELSLAFIIKLAISVIVLFAILYFMLSSRENIKSGIYKTVEIFDSDKIKKKIVPLETRGVRLILDCLIFSVVSFLSLGYSTLFKKRRLSLYGLVVFNYRGKGSAGILSGVEALFGIIFVILLIVSVIR